MAKGARKGGWPEKNPETNYFSGMATPTVHDSGWLRSPAWHQRERAGQLRSR